MRCRPRCPRRSSPASRRTPRRGRPPRSSPARCNLWWPNFPRSWSSGGAGPSGWASRAKSREFRRFVGLLVHSYAPNRELPMNKPMHPSDAYLRLAEGPDDLLGSELSLTRRLLTLLVAVVLFSGTSLFATAALDFDHGLVGKALAVTGKASHDGDDDDNSGPGGGDDEADDNDDHSTDVNNMATGGGASHSDDNDDGDSDSSEHQNAQRV